MYKRQIQLNLPVLSSDRIRQGLLYIIGLLSDSLQLRELCIVVGIPDAKGAVKINRSSGVSQKESVISSINASNY